MAQCPLHDIAEQPYPRRNRDLSFYLVLLFCVMPVWSAVPVSWLFVIHTLRSGKVWSFSGLWWTLFITALFEVFFSMYHYFLARHVSGPSPCGPENSVELQIAFKRVLHAGLSSLPADETDSKSLNTIKKTANTGTFHKLERDDPRAVDFRNSLRTWFGKAPWSSIHRHEMDIWLYWSIFNTHLPPADSLPQSHRIVLDEALDLLQLRAGCTLPEGSAPSIKPILLTLDTININWRPFSWYASIYFINWMVRMRMESKYNARVKVFKGLEFLIRIPLDWDVRSTLRPIVFIPGLGLGLFQYWPFLTDLMETFTDRPLLILIQPHISQNIFHSRFLEPMGRHEMSDCLAELICELGWLNECESKASDSEEEKEEVRLQVQYEGLLECRGPRGVTVLSHSNGSYTHGWILKAYPEMISRSCFVDPVTFCLWEGDVCYNFIYRPCATGIELLMRYFVGTELGVANLLQRHFEWSSNSLCCEEIPDAYDPEKTLFVLAGKDDIINAERVRRYLRSNGVCKGLLYDPEARHSQALLTGGETHTRILGWLQNDLQ